LRFLLTVVCENHRQLISCILSTVSAWLRFTGVDEDGRRSNCAFSLISSGDTNHVQTFFFEIMGHSPTISSNIAMTSRSISMDTSGAGSDVWSYWHKMTLTYTYYNSSYGSISHFYINDTLFFNYHASGNKLRFSDSTSLTMGGYALGDSKLAMQRRFIGSIDDFAIYNYAQSAEQVATTWDSVANTSDPGLVIYYNFDEGPGTTVIKNHGRAGSALDLYNGQVFGNSIWYDTSSGALRTVSAASWVSWTTLILCLFHRINYRHSLNIPPLNTNPYILTLTTLYVSQSNMVGRFCIIL
jgi:hypothetical protein